MTRDADIILTDLRELISNLGRDGGLQNGSVYDTAQVVRMAPPAEGVEQALEWLLASQHPDGGWDNPKVLRARDTPTLAAVLALHQRGQGARCREAVARGLEFLRQQAPHWQVLPDDLLVGVELTLPRLLDEAVALGLDVPVQQYAALGQMGARRRQKLAMLKMGPGMPPVHSWEGWGSEPDPSLMDATGGIALSPAATAAWVHAASRRPELKDAVTRARAYLHAAETGTDVRLPGIVPPSWPITRMEEMWGLLWLLWAGLLNEPRLADVVGPKADSIAAALTPRGIGFADGFMADGDCTGVSLALLRTLNRPVDLDVLQTFAREDSFVTYPGESNMSLTTTAHAVMAMELAGRDTTRWRQGLIRKQAADGRWVHDKWQTSWLYATSQVMLALTEHEPLSRALTTLLGHQQADGGWGTTGGGSNRVDTAFAVLTLRRLLGKGFPEQELQASLDRARAYLWRTYRPFVPPSEPMWIAKALYCPIRMDRSLELSAMLALALDAGR